MSRRGSSEELAVAKLFLEYYKRRFDELELPGDMDQREFAYQPFFSHSYVRHLSFTRPNELRNHITSSIRRAPKHLFYSAARYEFPAAADMEGKKWVGTDLIFDIDADDVSGCSFYTARLKDEVGGCREEKLVPTEDCLAKALDAALRLVDALVEDLGISKSAIRVSYSGNRGFHVLVVETPGDLLELPGEDRREIADYLAGEALDVNLLVPRPRGRKRRLLELAFNPGEEYGWRRRLMRALAKSGRPLKRREGVLVASVEEGELQALAGEEAVALDKKVSIDVSRLVRIPGSLHGKTGFAVKSLGAEASPESVREAPYPSPFNDIDIKVVLRYDMDARLPMSGGAVRGKRGDAVRLPGGMAVLLALRGLVTMVGVTR